MTTPALLRPRTLALLGVALLLLWWVARSVSLHVLLATLQELTALELSALLAVNLLIFATFAGRWWIFLRAQGHPIAYGRLLVYRLTAFGISYFTPGPHFGGEPYQVYITVRGHQTPPAVAIAAVTLDKALEMLTNFVFLVAGVFLLITRRGGLSADIELQLGVYVLLLPALPVGLLIALGRGRHPLTAALRSMDRLLGRLWRRPHHGIIPPTWLTTLRHSEDQAGALCRHHPRALAAGIAVSLVSWIGVIGEFRLLTAVLGLELSTIEATTALVVSRLAILLPLPAGLGALEVGLVLAMRGLGLDPSIGIALSLLIRARDVLFGLLGLWLGGLQFRQWTAPPRHDPVPGLVPDLVPDLEPATLIDRQNPAPPA